MIWTTLSCRWASSKSCYCLWTVYLFVSSPNLPEFPSRLHLELPEASLLLLWLLLRLVSTYSIKTLATEFNARMPVVPIALIIVSTHAKLQQQFIQRGH